MMKRREKNKGFTLVELIVVLVILAILAAILVPALLGYIDSARSKQTVLNARSAMTAAQAEMSTIYAEGKDPKIIADAPHKDQVANTADFNSLEVAGLQVACKTKYVDGTDVKKQHDAYTIAYVKYTDSTGTVWYVDGNWIDSNDSDSKGSAAGDVYTVK